MSKGPKPLESINPVDGSSLATHEQHSDGEIDSILDAVTEAQRSWADCPVEERASALASVASALRDNKGRYGELMTREMGKPLSEAEAEVEKCAWVCDYYAEQAARFLSPQKIDSDAERSEVVFRPLGTVFAIMPWNFPFWQAFRFAAPAMAAGNAIVLKHASNVTGCALAIEEVCGQAMPRNLFRTLILSSDRTERVIKDDRIAAVTFTGSTDAGRKVGEAAGGALKKSVLELGGSDPYVVLADADVKAAAKVCTAARMINGGQSCIAAKRFIVEEAVFDSFVEEMSRQFSMLTVGDPMTDGTDIGPMARSDLAEDLQDQVERSVKAGARIIAGGDFRDRKGAWFPPTILVDVTPQMPAFREELFGPIAAIIKARDADEAVSLANDSVFGLGAAVFSGDADRGWQIAADRIHAGTVAVNGQVKSDPRLPFGGVKESGYGRELGEFGIREFVNVKTVSRF